jgi:hypothetical protein
MDRYVGGIYVQNHYDPDNQTTPQDVQYYSMVNCSSLDLPIDAENYQSYYCPNMTSFELQGGLEARTRSQNTKTFGFKVFKCTTMNLIREQMLLPTVDCVSNRE